MSVIHKLSLDFIEKMYILLTQNSADVNFYCTRLRYQDNEKAVQNPIIFGLKVLRINILCRIPFLKKEIYKPILGKVCMSDFFVKTTIGENATQLIQNSTVITDIFNSVVVCLKSEDNIYKLVEKELNIGGFYNLRKKYNREKLPIDEIYQRISRKLKINIDYNKELEIFEKYSLPNRYIKNLLDIAKYNNINIVAIVSTSYPRNFINNLLSKLDIHVDKLILTNEEKKNFDRIILKNKEKHSILLSGNYNGFIQKGKKYGFNILYYKNPHEIMNYMKYNNLSCEFANIYLGIIGLDLFNGEKIYSFKYELVYIFLAPIIFGFMQFIESKSDKSSTIVFLSNENCIFNYIFKKYFKDIISINWSPFVNSEKLSKEDYEKIVDNSVIFKNSDMYIVDEKLNTIYKSKFNYESYKHYIVNNKTDIKNYIIDKLKDKNKLLIVDPLSVGLSTKSFNKILDKVIPNITYTSITVFDFLENCSKSTNIITKFIQGNNEIFVGPSNVNNVFLYPQRVNKNINTFINEAFEKFVSTFINYIKNNDENFKIDCKNATALYECGYNKLVNYEEKTKNIFGDEL